MRLPDGWQARVGESFRLWQRMPDSLREQVAGLAEAFAPRRVWEASAGFAMPDDAPALIAAQACLLLSRVGLDALGRGGPIVLHPTTIRRHDTSTVGHGGLVTDTPEALDGQTTFRGPVLLSWPAVVHEAWHPLGGRNVVLHEFAHELDMDDGQTNGTPTQLPDALRVRWQRVCTAEYEAVRRGEPSELRDYAGTDPGEFFAVATETFFCRPTPFADRHPALYDLFLRYYACDPATW